MDIQATGSDLVWRASEIDTGTVCARKLGYSRLGMVSPETGEIEKIKNTYSWDLVGGLAVDDVVCKVAEQQMIRYDGSDYVDPADAVSLFDARWKYNEAMMLSKGTIENDEEHKRSIFADGRAVVDLYVREHAPGMKPLAVQTLVEKNIETSVGTVRLVGHVDLIREGGPGPDGQPTKIISDWKFTKKTPNQMPARTYTRGWAYDLMAGDSSHQIELIYLRKGLKTPKIETNAHFVTEGERIQVVKQLDTLVKMYKARYFPMADPTSWACSPDWCGMWSQCRGNPNGPAKIPGEE